MNDSLLPVLAEDINFAFWRNQRLNCGMFYLMDKLKMKLKLSALGSIAPLSALGFAALLVDNSLWLEFTVCTGGRGKLLTVVKMNA